MAHEQRPFVAKSGGTSQAHPEWTRRHIQQALRQNKYGAWIFSAPGKDYPMLGDYTTKMTDMLMDYEYDPSDSTKKAVLHRLGKVAGRATGAPGNQAMINAVVANAPRDLDRWQQDGAPLAPLGEYWSTCLMSAYVFNGRTSFVDAASVVAVRNGSVDSELTEYNVKQRMSDFRRTQLYLMAGFYGCDEDGQIVTLSRGGSDQTGAEIARALQASEYLNFSDVPGFLSADPRLVASAKFIAEMTYAEKRELANNGTELLHREVGRILGETGIRTVMCNTFAEGDPRGTSIVDSREFRSGEVVGVNVTSNLLKVSRYEYGMNEDIGAMSRLTTAFSERAISIEDTMTGKDHIAVTVQPVDHKNVQRSEEEIQKIYEVAGLQGAQVSPIARVTMVGEGLGEASLGRTRMRAMANLALVSAGIADVGEVASIDQGKSLGVSLFVHPDDAETAAQVVHDAVITPQ